MKQLIIILSILLIATASFSQTTGQKVVVKVQGAVTTADVSQIVKDSILTKLAIADTAAMLMPYIRTVDADASYYPLTTNPSNYLQNVSGLIIEGSNVTITGDGTTDNPFVINSTGGSGDSTVIKVQQPIYYDALDSTLKFNRDSLYNVLKYTAAARDSSNYDDSTLVPKDYLNQRLAGINGGSVISYDSTITATSSQTDFTFSSFPSTASYISVFINSCAIDDSYYTYDAATQTLTFTSGTVDGDKIRLHIIE